MIDSPIELQRILAVDDNTYTLRIVKHTLEQAGYQVSTAVSGEEALTTIDRYGLPHLAIVDLHMPGMSGFELCRTIHDFSDVPVIMLTAVASEETIIEGLEEHAEDYIVKPFNPPELVARVERVLRRMGDLQLHPWRQPRGLTSVCWSTFPNARLLSMTNPCR